MRVALLQMTSGIDPVANSKVICDAIANAAQEGAEILFTPEMCGMLDRNRTRASSKIRHEDQDLVLASACDAARQAGIYACLGSLAIRRTDDAWVNRSFVIDPTGKIVARYDKMHMFDVELATGESWRESAAYAAGDALAVIEKTPFGRLGLTICYDLR